MRETNTDYGNVRIGAAGGLFAAAALAGVEAWRAAPGGRFSWALTGGSTPKHWYRWCVENRVLPAELLRDTHWFASDERHVPLASDESNFGNAQRLLLDPLGVTEDHRHPWPVEMEPVAAAAEFAERAAPPLGAERGFSLCFLGLGDDAHTASLFPGSPLLGNDGRAPLAAVEVPGKGWRLTITPSGLRVCGRIVVMAVGAAKAEAVWRVFRGVEPVEAVPAKILRACAPHVTWLLDEEAAARL